MYVGISTIEHNENKGNFSVHIATYIEQVHGWDIIRYNIKIYEFLSGKCMDMMVRMFYEDTYEKYRNSSDEVLS